MYGDLSLSVSQIGDETSKNILFIFFGRVDHENFGPKIFKILKISRKCVSFNRIPQSGLESDFSFFGAWLPK